MLTRLEAALLQGVALASLGIGCAGKAETAPSDGGGGSTTGTGGTSDGGAPETGGVAGAGGGVASGGQGTGGDSSFDPSSLPWLPTDREFPHRVGVDHGDGPYYGYCTGQVHCAELLEGECPALDNLWGNVPGYPSGSGSCSCTGNGEVERSEEGPFQRDSELSPAKEPGPCCYVVYSIGCDGRPLCAEGRFIVAEVVLRNDWGAPRFGRA